MMSGITSIKAINQEIKNNSIIVNTPHNLLGRCYTIRVSGDQKIIFTELLDASTIVTIQCIFRKENFTANIWHDLLLLKRFAVLSLSGNIIKSIGFKQDYEMDVTQIIFMTPMLNPDSHPLISRAHIPITSIHDHPHLAGQHKFYLALQIVKKQLMWSLHQTMKNLGIGEIKPTEITTNSCEEGCNPFTVTTLPIIKKSVSDIGAMDTSIDDGGSEDDDMDIDGEENGNEQDDSEQDGSEKDDSEKLVANYFKNDFFNKQVYLTVSNQLHLEAITTTTLQDSYSMTISFRAEKSKTPMHLAEFLMVEWENIGDMDRVIMVAQELILNAITSIITNCEDEINFIDNYVTKDNESEYKKQQQLLNKKRKTMNKKDYVAKLKTQKNNYETTIKNKSQLDILKDLLVSNFATVTHADCITQLLTAAGNIKNNSDAETTLFAKIPEYEGDLSREHEKYIANVLYPESIGVFVTNYPKKVKSFYMPEIPVTENNNVTNAADDTGVSRVKCFDLIMKTGEIAGGSQRIDNYETLKARMSELNIDCDNLNWYLDLRKYSNVPHAGAGLGFSRLLMNICGINNLRLLEDFTRAAGAGIVG